MKESSYWIHSQGSGTVGEAALTLGRRCLLIDSNPEAIEVMERRLPDADVVRQ